MEQVSSEARGWKDLGHLDYDHDAVTDHVWQHKSVTEFLLDFGKGGSSSEFLGDLLVRVPGLEGTQTTCGVSRWPGVPGTVPGTRHGTAVLGGEEPAQLQRWSSGPVGCSASGGRKCGSRQGHPGSGALLQAQADPGAQAATSAPPDTDGSHSRNVPGCGRTVCWVTQLTTLFSLVGTYNGDLAVLLV